MKRLLESWSEDCSAQSIECVTPCTLATSSSKFVQSPQNICTYLDIPTNYRQWYTCLNIFSQCSYYQLYFTILNIILKHNLFYIIMRTSSNERLCIGVKTVLRRALHVYTGKNPRRHVISIKTSQMRTICTLIRRESCRLVYIFVSAFTLGGKFLYMYFHTELAKFKYTERNHPKEYWGAF